MADANVTLTQAQLAAGFVFNCTGANTATRNLIVPAISRFFTVINSTTGGHGVLAKTPSGTGITVTAAMGATLLFCDGTNVISLGASGGGGGGGGTWEAVVPTGTRRSTVQTLLSPSRTRQTRRRVTNITSKRFSKIPAEITR